MTDTIDLIAKIATMIAAIWALVATIRGNRKVDRIQIEIDGRLTQLLKSVGAEQHALGRSEGVESERNRT